jgi:hypothetical protein
VTLGKAEDLTGQKFHKLTVVRYEGRDKWGYPVWLCQCECGNFTKATSGKLKGKPNARRTSCGCSKPNGHGAHKEKTFPKLTFDVFYRVLREYRDSAEVRGHAWELAPDIAIGLFKSDCYYCGTPPSAPKRLHKKDNPTFMSGIDRLDSRVGYTESNCVPCCRRCNYMKGSMTADEFLTVVKAIYRKHSK